MQVELKPCPFCESRVISEYRDGDYWIIKCAQCGAEIAHTQHQKACFAWNRRHQARAEVVGEIVAWLRSDKIVLSMDGSAEEVANAIEAGDHWRPFV